MAWMSQEKKAELAPKVKAVLKKYGMKGSISVRNHSTLVISIKTGSLDMIANYNDAMKNRPKPTYWTPAKDSLDINPHWYDEHFTGDAKKFLKELFDAANAGNHDRSDSMTDYFDVGWYVDVNVGGWNKPYLVV